jgi:DNA-binding response OmpR family regulator
MCILVIDDDGAILEMISQFLKREGYKVLIASNGKEGMMIINKTPEIYLVITDLIMPEKEGMEIIRELKQDFPHIKILAISGGGLGSVQTYLSAAKLIGADLTLKKPFVAEELLRSVQELTSE